MEFVLKCERETLNDRVQDRIPGASALDDCDIGKEDNKATVSNREAGEAALEQRPEAARELVTWLSGQVPPSTRNTSAKTPRRGASSVGPSPVWLELGEGEVTDEV